MKRLLSPATNLPGWMTLGFTAYAVIQAVLNARAHHTAIGPAVIVAALAAGLAAYTRTQVTPVSSPRDGNGDPLVPAPAKPQLVLTAEEMAAIRRMLDAAFVVPTGPTVTVTTSRPITADEMVAAGARTITTAGSASPQPAPPEGGTTP